jgi:predicted glycosyltransferase
MNISIFVNTPAQVHFYKNIAKGLEKKGHKIIFLARKYRETIPVLDLSGIKYQVYSRPPDSQLGKVMSLPANIMNACAIMKKFKSDIVLGFGGPEAYTAFLLNKPAIVFQDSEPHIDLFFLLQYKLFMPLIKTIITPDIFSDDLGKKHIRIKSFKEMAYLHPSIFKPDESIFDLLDIDRNKEFIILRFNALDAVHDFKIKGFSIEEKRDFIRELEKYVKVFISAEKQVPKDLERYLLKIPKNRIHDCIYYAKMILTDTQTMATEAGLLGTPVVRYNSFVGSKDMANFIELEQNYHLIFNYNNSKEAIKKSLEIVTDPDVKNKWRKRKQKFMDEKINITEFMVWFIDNFPESYLKIKENPNLQNKFK